MQRKLTVVLALSSLVTAGEVGVATADATELPVYGVKSSGLDQEQAQKLQRAFGLKDVQRSEFGAVSFADEQRYQLVFGSAGFKGKPDEDGEIEIGYGISPHYRRQGYTFEAASALKDWAFAHPEVRQLNAECLPDNVGSARILQKLGMTNLGIRGGYIRWKLRR